MYIKNLNLHGFKSFAIETNIEFNEGVTVVLGPNGIGKSNIVEAFLWVLCIVTSVCGLCIAIWIQDYRKKQNNDKRNK